MSVAAEINFSELSNKPADSVRKLQAAPNQTLLVRRRGDEEDLVLTTASRAEEVREVVSFTTSLFVALMRHSEESRGMLAELTPTVFPWVRFLPDKAKKAFVAELMEVLEASNSLGSPAPVVHAITAWRATAEIHSDPRLLAIATRDNDADDDEDEDLDEVPEPAATTV